MPYKDHLPTKVELDRRNRRQGTRSNSSLFQAVPPTISGSSNRVGQQQPTTATTERTGFPILFEIDDRSDNHDAVVNIDLSQSNAHYHVVQISDKDADDNDIEEVQINFLNAVKDRDIEFVLILINNPDNENQPTVSFAPHLVGLPAGFPNAFEYVFKVAFAFRDEGARYDILNRGAAGGGSPTVLDNLNENNIGEIGDITQIINWEEANFHRFIATGDVNIAFNNPPDMGKWQEIILEITQDDDGDHDITFGNTIVNGTPVIDTDADAVTRLRFYHRAGVYAWAPWFASGGSGLLSELTIDTDKDWAARNITNLQELSMSLTGTSEINNVDFMTWGWDADNSENLFNIASLQSGDSTILTFDTPDFAYSYRFRSGSSTILDLTSFGIDAFENLDMNSNGISNVSILTFTGIHSIFGSNAALTINTLTATGDLIFTAAGIEKGRYDGGVDGWTFRGGVVSLRPTNDIILDTGDDIIFRHTTTEVGRYNGDDSEWQFSDPLDMGDNAINGLLGILFTDFHVITSGAEALTIGVAGTDDIRFTVGGTEKGRFDGGTDSWSLQGGVVSLRPSNDIILNAGDDITMTAADIITITTTAGAITLNPALDLEVMGNLDMNSNGISNVSLISFTGIHSIFGSTAALTINTLATASDLIFTTAGVEKGRFDGGLDAWRFVGTSITLNPTSIVTISPTGNLNLIPGNDVVISAEVDMNNNKITELGTPTADTDAATKKYVDDNGGGGASDRITSGNNSVIVSATNVAMRVGTGTIFTLTATNLGIIPTVSMGGNLTVAGTTGMFDDLDMNQNKITDLATPTADSDAATKEYVDDNGGGGGARDRIEDGNDSVIVDNNSVTMRINSNAIWILTATNMAITQSISAGNNITVAGTLQVFGNTTLQGSDVRLDPSDDLIVTAGDDASISAGGVISLTAGEALSITSGGNQNVSILSSANLWLSPNGHIDVRKDMDMGPAATVDFSRTASVPSGSADGAIVVKVGGVDKRIPYYDV